MTARGWCPGCGCRLHILDRHADDCTRPQHERDYEAMFSAPYPGESTGPVPDVRHLQAPAAGVG